MLHVARDLGAALRRIRAALAPDGWLVAGECLRLFPGQPVPAELVFQLFKSFVEVETDPELRPDNGFLEPRHWRLALGRAGFVDVGVVPDLERIRAGLSPLLHRRDGGPRRRPYRRPLRRDPLMPTTPQPG